MSSLLVVFVKRVKNRVEVVVTVSAWYTIASSEPCHFDVQRFLEAFCDRPLAPRKPPKAPTAPPLLISVGGG